MTTTSHPTKRTSSSMTTTFKPTTKPSTRTTTPSTPMTKPSLIKNLQQMDTQLENLIDRLEKLDHKVTGTLYVAAKREPAKKDSANKATPNNDSANKDIIQFYKYDGTTKTYLGKDRHDEVVELANKTYHDRMLTAAKEEKRQIERCLKALDSGKGYSDISDVFPSLHKAMRELVTPLGDTDEAFALEWYKKRRFAVNHTREVNSALITARGEVVKSKSEIIIADRLYSLGIPYVYECTFATEDDFRSRYPDFLILNKRTRKEYIWEHQGKMDDRDYCLDSQYKLEWFCKRGYILGKNLIFTYEGSARPLSTMYVDALIKEYLL